MKRTIWLCLGIVVVIAGVFLLAYRSHRATQRAAIVRVFTELKAVSANISQRESVLQKQQDFINAARQIKLDDCPVPFDRAWLNLLFQCDEVIHANKNKNTRNGAKVLEGVVTGGFSLLSLDMSDEGKPARVAFEQVRLVCLDYGIQ